MIVKNHCIFAWIYVFRFRLCCILASIQLKIDIGLNLTQFVSFFKFTWVRAQISFTGIF
jgi:hypothetical protein